MSGEAATPDQVEAVEALGSDKWPTVVPVTSLGAGYQETSRTLVEVKDDRPCNYVRSEPSSLGC